MDHAQLSSPFSSGWPSPMTTASSTLFTPESTPADRIPLSRRSSSAQFEEQSNRGPGLRSTQSSDAAQNAVAISLQPEVSRELRFLDRVLSSAVVPEPAPKAGAGNPGGRLRSVVSVAASDYPAQPQQAPEDTGRAGRVAREASAAARKAASFCRSWPLWLAAVQLCCVTYILVMTFSPAPMGAGNPSTGFIDPAPRPTVLAADAAQCVMLAISRASAFALYPPLVIMMLTKCKALLSWAEGTPVAIHVQLLNAHEMHAMTGRFVGFAAVLHTVAHCIRWAMQQSLGRLLVTTASGVSGLIAIILLPLISLPMMLPARLRARVSYEIRKALHYLFLPFCAALAAHAPVNAVPNGGFIAYVMGCLLAVWALDSAYCWFCLTSKVLEPHFQVFPHGVQMTLPMAAERSEGFVYVCVPWVSKHQWHAFSIFPHPQNRSLGHVHMQACGDWTHAVHKAVQVSTRRPVWVQGPFLSPYKKAIHFDNQVLVATGIGVTPALSVIENHRETRRANLIWIVRDKALLEFCLKSHNFCDSAWNLIYYTGKAQLSEQFVKHLPPNIRIFSHRPDLNVLIPSIVMAVEVSANSLDEEAGQQRVCDNSEAGGETGMSSEQGQVPLPCQVSTPEDISALDRMLNGHRPVDAKLLELAAFSNQKGLTVDQLITGLGHPPSNGPPGSAASDAGYSSPSSLLQVKCAGGSPQAPRLNVASGPLDQAAAPNKAQNSSTSSHQQLGQPCLAPVPTLSSDMMPMQVQNSIDMPKAFGSVTCAQGSTSANVTCADAPDFLRGMSRDSLKRWGILYCGGAAPVQSALKGIGRTYKISCSFESFAW